MTRYFFFPDYIFYIKNSKLLHKFKLQTLIIMWDLHRKFYKNNDCLILIGYFYQKKKKKNITGYCPPTFVQVLTFYNHSVSKKESGWQVIGISEQREIELQILLDGWAQTYMRGALLSKRPHNGSYPNHVKQLIHPYVS